MKLKVRVWQGWEFLAVCLAAALVFWPAVSQVAFTPDESDWIGTSQFWEAFITGRFPADAWHSPAGWGASYWTMTQPPMARYLIGIGRAAAGYAPGQLNTPWNWNLTNEENVAVGNMPSGGLLASARLPMVVLDILSAGLLYLLAKAAGGRLAGVVTAVFYLASPYFQETLLHAWSEPVVLFFTLLALAVLLLGLARLNREEPERIVSRQGLTAAFGLFALTGVCCGLAGAAKLNGLLTAGGAAIVIFVAYLAGKPGLPVRMRWTMALRAPVVTVLIAYAVFVAVNPFLYSDPVFKTGQMYKFRLEEMKIQQEGFPDSCIQGLGQRVSVLFQQLFTGCAAVHFPGAWLLNFPFFLLGIVQLGRNAWGRLSKGGHNGGDGAAALLALGPVVLAALATPLDWQRYYLFPVVLATICIALGIWRAVRFFTSREFTKSLGLPRRIAF